MISLISLLGSLTIYNLRSSLESGPGALRGGGGECGIFAQTEDRGWVHRNGGWERVSVCGMDGSDIIREILLCRRKPEISRKTGSSAYFCDIAFGFSVM